MNKLEFNLAVFSDLHLGHPKNKASDIINGLNKALPDNEETRKLDLLVLAGDVFDRLLNLPDDDVREIDLWIYRLFYICNKYKIKFRVLEGTPSHDRKQSSRFETILEVSSFKVDFQYIKALSIEYIKDFDINVLYVPDEWDTPEKTLEQVKVLLENKGISKVDFAFMHGQFEYQLPANIKGMPRHSSVAYLALVKYYIFIGHIHVHSSLDRILAQGSHDRLSHGEEGPKGHIRATITEDESQWFFIENKLARIYKTIKCKNIDLEKSLSYIKKEVEKLPDQSCVRISVEKNHPILANMNQLVAMYPTITWSKLVKVEKEKETELLEEVIHEAVIINKENIVSLLMDRINKNHTDQTLVLRCEKLLLDVV